jgi:hypothetical protein
MRVRIPPPDVAPVEVDPVTKRFRWTQEWYDVMKGLEKLGLSDLAAITTTVAGLPSATKGGRYFVTDATASTFNSIVAGGGSNNVPVFADGTNWRIG